MMQTPHNWASADALAQARREGALAERRRARRRLLIGWGLSIVFVLIIFLGGLLVAVQAQKAAPGVISDIVAERRAAVEEHLRDRRQEAVALIGDVFDFLGLVWLESEPVRQIRASVVGARAQLGELDAELRAALRSPFTEFRPLIENGPTRARYLANQLVIVAHETRQLAALVFQALAEVRESFHQDHDGSPIPRILSSMDALLDPFLGQNQPLHARWTHLKADISAWGERVQANLDDTREQMQGDALGQEFLQRITRQLF